MAGKVTVVWHGITLAMHYRLKWLVHIWTQPKKGR